MIEFNLVSSGQSIKGDSLLLGPSWRLLTYNCLASGGGGIPNGDLEPDLGKGVL